MRSRHVTPRSLYNDLRRGKYDCEDDLRAPLISLVKRVGSFEHKRKEVWKKTPVLEVIDEIIRICEALLWDSGELTENEETQRQRIYVQVVDIKNQIKRITNCDG